MVQRRLSTRIRRLPNISKYFAMQRTGTARRTPVMWLRLMRYCPIIMDTSRMILVYLDICICWIFSVDRTIFAQLSTREAVSNHWLRGAN